MLFEIPATIETATPAIVTPSEDDTKLAKCVTAIHKATAATQKKLAGAYLKFLKDVGPHLESAYQVHKSRPGNSWGKWCKDELLWSKRHADRLRSAYGVITRLEAAEIDKLPSGEAHCRTLAKVGDDNIVDAWQTVLDQCGADASATVIESTLANDKRYSASFESSAKSNGKPVSKSPEESLRESINAALSKLPAAKRKALLAKSVAELVEGGAA